MNSAVKRWKVKESLLKPPKDRTEADVSHISELLAVRSRQTNSFCSQYPPDRLLLLSGQIELRQYKTGSFVFKEGDAGENFYIIFEGRMGIFIKEKGKVAELNRDDSFGELALLYGQPRSASVKAL